MRDIKEDYCNKSSRNDDFLKSVSFRKSIISFRHSDSMLFSNFDLDLSSRWIIVIGSLFKFEFVITFFFGLLQCSVHMRNVLFWFELQKLTYQSIKVFGLLHATISGSGDILWCFSWSIIEFCELNNLIRILTSFLKFQKHVDVWGIMMSFAHWIFSKICHFYKKNLFQNSNCMCVLFLFKKNNYI